MTWLGEMYGEERVHIPDGFEQQPVERLVRTFSDQVIDGIDGKRAVFNRSESECEELPEGDRTITRNLAEIDRAIAFRESPPTIYRPELAAAELAELHRAREAIVAAPGTRP